MRARGVVAAAALVASMAASPLRAQYVEIVPLATAGYTSDHALDLAAGGIDEVKIEGGFTWGGQVAWFFSPRIGVEGSWMQQQTKLSLATPSGSADLFDMTVGQLHANFVYQFGAEEAMLRPFAFAGAGVTIFSATDLDGETKFSWGAGAGVKLFLSDYVGLRIQGRYKATRLDDAGQQGFCDPFGFCQDRLGQWEFSTGVALRF